MGLKAWFWSGGCPIPCTLIEVTDNREYGGILATIRINREVEAGGPYGTGGGYTLYGRGQRLNMPVSMVSPRRTFERGARPSNEGGQPVRRKSRQRIGQWYRAATYPLPLGSY
jgi:hypothetical protein